MNLVEVWFGIIERQAIRRGTFTLRQRPQHQDPQPSSTAGTTAAHPFVWTKTADEILTKANRQTTSEHGPLA